MKAPLASLLILPAVLLCGQQKAVLEFDVASVKPSRESGFSSSQRSVGGKLSLRNVSLFSIILNAYDVAAQRLSGAPPWTMNERFDIDAVAEEDVAITGEKARERNRLRLRSLLEQRFQLKLHRETRIISSYVLVLGRKGPRLKQANSDEGSSLRLNPSRDHLEGRGQAMDALADFLWTELERPVFNQTGLREEYDFDLDFQPERHDPSSGAKPSLMAAIQEQLGLKLQARKMPVELLVVDGVERPKGN